MRKISVFIAMAAVALTSCVKEEVPVVEDNNNNQTEFVPSGELVEKVFTVGTADTKTYIDGEVTSNGKLVIKWCEDDAINVWDGVANRKFEMVGAPNGNKATFKGMVDANATDFYAVYPYDENFKYTLKSNGDMIFSLDRPAVQYANPEGGLADGAVVSAGKVVFDENGNGTIRFENRSTLLKFSFVKGMDVTSITLKGNEADDLIAGTYNLKYNATSNFTGGWENNDKKSTQITFCNEDGSPLKTGVDYYMALSGNKFGQGYTITVTLADGTTLERSSDKSIQYYTNAVNILASKPLSRTMFGLGYYEAYMGGEDLEIAGKVYNKADAGALTPTLLTATTTISADGMYFLAPEAGNTITLSTTKLNNIIVVGNNPAARTELAHSGYRLNAAAKVVAMNVILPDSGQQLIQEAVDGAALVAFDNCAIYPTKASSGQICYNGTTAKTAIQDYRMVNCDYIFSKEAAVRDGSMMLNCVMTGADVTIKNNLFYTNEPNVATWKFKLASVAGKMNSFVMVGNTFVDMIVTGGDTGYCKSGVDFENLTVQDNLFYVSQDTKTKNQFVFNGSLTPSSILVDHNAYYQVPEITTEFNMFGTTPSGQKKTPTKLTASPFSSMDHANGVFVKTSEAAAYGAKR